MSTDRIEKEFDVRAPVSRVWRALTNHQEFSAWFQLAIDTPFTAGATLFGRFTKPGCDEVRIEFRIEQIEPEHFFSWRWHPFAIDPKVDYSQEPMTLVEIKLRATADGTRVTIVESGFDAIPISRRMESFRMNSSGWNSQAANLTRHVS